MQSLVFEKDAMCTDPNQFLVCVSRLSGVVTVSRGLSYQPFKYKLFTHVFITKLCKMVPAIGSDVLVWLGRSGIRLAMHHRLIGFSDGDEDHQYQ